MMIKPRWIVFRWHPDDHGDSQYQDYHMRLMNFYFTDVDEVYSPDDRNITRRNLTRRGNPSNVQRWRNLVKFAKEHPCVDD